MRNRSYIGSLTTLFVLVIAVGFMGSACGTNQDNNANNANNTMTPVTTPDVCASVTDDWIKFTIYGQIAHDTSIPIKQINVSVEKGVVTLTGFVNNSEQKANVVRIAENTLCAKKPVNVDNFYDCARPPVQPDSLGGCGAGWVRCGDICVPNHCFWNDAPAPGTTPSPVTPATSATPCPPTPTPKPSPDSNTNKPAAPSNSKY